MLQYFYAGLDKEFAHHLDLTSGGSFARLTPTESREVLDKILDRTSFVCIHEPVPTEPEMHLLGTPPSGQSPKEREDRKSRTLKPMPTTSTEVAHLRYSSGRKAKTIHQEH